MRTIDDLKRWKKYGFILTPANEDKSPGEYPNQKWKLDWSDEALLRARLLGMFHDASSVFTIDFDDKDYVAHKYISLLPDTFTDGKIVDGKRILTHKTYKLNGTKPTFHKYPKKVSKEKGLLLECLTTAHTIFHGQDRFIALDDPPAQVNIEELEKKLNLICFFTEVEKAFPAEGGRDEAHLRLAGALAKLPAAQYPDELLEDFQTQLCINTGDNEIKNRTNKIKYQRKQLANGKKIFGITELRSHLNSELAAYSLLIDETEEELPESEKLFDTDPKEYPLIDGNMEDIIEYPKVEYLMNPIINTRSFNQTYGWYESGKTIFGMSLAMHMSSGHDFLGWSCDKKIPTAYLESELPGDTIRGIKHSIRLGWLDKNQTYNGDWTFSLNQDNLIAAGFKYGFRAIAVAKEHGKRAAIDYGRRGREFIEDWLHKIEKKTGHKPFYFLDNMTRLATIDENKAQDWNPFLNWGTDLKHKGFSGMFVHHANKNKDGKGSSGSSTIGRLLDTSIELRALDQDYRFNIPGSKSVQSSIEFDKSRGFGGSEWSKKRIITMNEGGEWNHYPYLKQVSFEILKLSQQGLTQQEIRAMANNKEIGEPPLSAPSVDRLYLELVRLKLIKKQIRNTRCWSCGKELETNKDPDCSKCTTGIKCTCGKCICDRPKKLKKEDDYDYENPY